MANQIVEVLIPLNRVICIECYNVIIVNDVVQVLIPLNRVICIEFGWTEKYGTRYRECLNPLKSGHMY